MQWVWMGVGSLNPTAETWRTSHPAKPSDSNPDMVTRACTRTAYRYPVLLLLQFLEGPRVCRIIGAGIYHMTIIGLDDVIVQWFINRVMGPERVLLLLGETMEDKSKVFQCYCPFCVPKKLLLAFSRPDIKITTKTCQIWITVYVLLHVVGSNVTK